MSQSLWTATEDLPKFPPLHGDARTQILIIGGGICGILCAYFMKLAGVDYILAEGNRICNGITAGTTAKITSQHGVIYDHLIRNQGKELAAMYLQANEKALDTYRKLAKEIDCDFEERDSYVYSMIDRQKIEREVQAVNSLGFPAEYTQDLPLPFQTEGAVKFPKQAQFHPLKFVAGIAENLTIYEHTFINDIKGHTAYTQDGEITADKIIVATHFPFINRHGSYFMKLYQHRSYVIALDHAPDLHGMYKDEATDGLSFRNYKDLLLVGGGSHRTGKSGGNWMQLREFISSCYPDTREKYFWAAQDCMSLDKIPYIGTYSASTPNLYVASGFNKWGMTSSMVSALLLSDLVFERENEWCSLFSPSRSMLTPQLFLNSMEAAADILTPSFKRCPHMGCALKWNNQEHTWDCPCHGSRFEKDGALIDNPSKRGAHIE